MLDLLVEQIYVTDDNRLVFDATMLFKHALGHREIYRKLVWGVRLQAAGKRRARSSEQKNGRTLVLSRIGTTPFCYNLPHPCI